VYDKFVSVSLSNARLSKLNVSDLIYDWNGGVIHSTGRFEGRITKTDKRFIQEVHHAAYAKPWAAGRDSFDFFAVKRPSSSLPRIGSGLWGHQTWTLPYSISPEWSLFWYGC